MTATVTAPQPTLAATTSARRKFKNNLATVLVTGSFVVALIPLVWLLYTVISRGLHALTRNGWFTESQRDITYKDPGGGAYHAILGTFEQVLLCSIISIPIAVLVGVYLVEYGRGWIARTTTFMVDILTGIPSIVAALFIYAVFVTAFGGSRAGWLVSLALVMLMIPVIVRTTEEMLKLVPNELREASYALGVPKWKTILRVVLPTAFTGILTGIVLGIARVAGETAPLLILVGYSPNTNSNLFGGFQGSLPGMINDQVANIGNTRVLVNGRPVSIHYAADRMWGAALTLIIIVMLLNVIARIIAGRSKITN
jgi:phosphate transport system permease protein